MRSYSREIDEALRTAQCRAPADQLVMGEIRPPIRVHQIGVVRQRQPTLVPVFVDSSAVRVADANRLTLRRILVADPQTTRYVRRVVPRPHGTRLRAACRVLEHTFRQP